jgi:hypothetical protein
VDEPTGDGVSCSLCGRDVEIVDRVRIDGRVFGLCESCSAEHPMLVRSTGAKARVLGREVDDVRGRLRE